MLLVSPGTSCQKKLPPKATRDKENEPSPISQLNKELFAAINQNDFRACRALIRQNADPNAKEETRTAIQIAIGQKKWLAFRVLRDEGARLTDHDRMRVRSGLFQERTIVTEWNQTMFILPHPNPCELQILVGDKFVPLAENGARIPSYLPRPHSITLFNIAFENITKNYGAVSRYLVSNDEFASVKWNNINVRVCVDNKQQFPSVIQKMREILPLSIPITTWVLIGHGGLSDDGTCSEIEIGNERDVREDALFRPSDAPLMQAVSGLLHEKATVILDACCSAPVAQTFALNAPGHLVFGSPVECANTTFIPVTSPSGHSMVAPLFRDIPKMSTKMVSLAFQNGEQVINEVFENTQQSDAFKHQVETLLS